MSLWSQVLSPKAIFDTLSGFVSGLSGGDERNPYYNDGSYSGSGRSFVSNTREGLEKHNSSVFDSVKSPSSGSGGVTFVPPGNSGAETYYDSTTVPEDIYGEWTPYLEYLREQSDENTRWNEMMAERQNEWQRQTNAIQMDFNAAEAQKNRDWQEMMSNTAHQREVEDLKAAGLNPILSATGGNGAAVTSGATASGATSSGVKPEKDSTFVLGLLNFLNNVMGYATSTASAGISAGGVMGAAALTAEATRYASDNSLAGTHYSSDTTYRNSQNNTSTPWALFRRTIDAALSSAWNDPRVSGYGVGNKWYNSLVNNWQTRKK